MSQIQFTFIESWNKVWLVLSTFLCGSQGRTEQSNVSANTLSIFISISLPRLSLLHNTGRRTQNTIFSSETDATFLWLHQKSQAHNHRKHILSSRTSPFFCIFLTEWSDLSARHCAGWWWAERRNPLWRSGVCSSHWQRQRSSKVWLDKGRPGEL